MFINVCVTFHKYVYVFTYVHRVCMIPLVRNRRFVILSTIDCPGNGCTFFCRSSFIKVILE